MNINPLDLLILILATCYWSFVIPKKAGPFNAFQRLRDWHSIGGLLLCPPCLSVWVGVLCWLLWQTPAAPLVTISALAGGATLLGYYTGTWQQ